jgi:hypothetical protein
MHVLCYIFLLFQATFLCSTTVELNICYQEALQMEGLEKEG